MVVTIFTTPVSEVNAVYQTWQVLQHLLEDDGPGAIEAVKEELTVP